LFDNYSKDICFPLSGGALKINLWHGIPLKKIQRDNLFDHVRNPKNRWGKIRWWLRRVSDEKPSDYILAPSEFLRPIFESAFATKRVIICGYPRNDKFTALRIQDVVTDNEKEMMEYIRLKRKECRTVFYLPTFRDSETGFFDVIDTERLRAFLERENLLLVVKLHPKSKLVENFKRLSGNHILVLDPMEDPYPVLTLTDILVTDYSSVYFDFLLTGRPIVFFPYDLKEYLSDTREFYFNYDEFTPGKKVYNQNELEAAILYPSGFQKERETVLAMAYTNPDVSASEILYASIMRLIH
jgi:CDP-glycerol glycerophosphotransferase (TagB/SpsB family)